MVVVWLQNDGGICQLKNSENNTNIANGINISEAKAANWYIMTLSS